MSPEIYSCLDCDGFKADVWSLGVSLWGMITGGLIYDIASPSDKRFRILAKGEEGIRLLLQHDGVHDVPPLLVHLLSKMLEIDPRKRYLTSDILAHPWLGLNSQVKKPAQSSTSALLESKSSPLPVTSPLRLPREMALLALSPKKKVAVSPSISWTFSFASTELLQRAKSLTVEKMEKAQRTQRTPRKLSLS